MGHDTRTKKTRVSETLPLVFDLGPRVCDEPRRVTGRLTNVCVSEA
jgi:hypothetical protein